MSSRIRIDIADNLNEEWLMSAISRIIEATSYQGIPYRKEGTYDQQWALDSHNDWAARIVRKGEIPYIGEQPLEHDALEVYYRYGTEPLESLKPWLEYKFGKKTG